jgi:hypothetical protein
MLKKKQVEERRRKKDPSERLALRHSPQLYKLPLTPIG